MKENSLPMVLQGIQSEHTLDLLLQKHPWCGALFAIKVKHFKSQKSSLEYKDLLKQAAIRMPFRENLYFFLQEAQPTPEDFKQVPATLIPQVWQDQEKLPTTLIQTEEPVKEEASLTEVIEPIQIETPILTIEEVEKPIISLQEKILTETEIQKSEVIENETPSTLINSPTSPNLLSFDDWISLYRSGIKPEIAKEESLPVKENTSATSVTNSKDESNVDLEDWTELNKLIQTSSPYDLFGLEKDLTEKQVESVNRFIGNEINRKKQKRNPQDGNGLPADELITETLAKLYWKQGKSDKAIAAFRRLALKFPEKSAYFASLISEIEKSSK